MGELLGCAASIIRKLKKTQEAEISIHIFVHAQLLPTMTALSVTLVMIHSNISDRNPY